jgi:hypothetical protein
MIRRFALSVLLLVSAIGQGAGGDSDEGRMRSHIVRQVDHIVVESDDPAGLFRFFNRTLGLPVAWSAADGDTFQTGGVGAGNVTLAILPAAGAAGKAGKGRARCTGLAFEPYPLADALRELRVRGIPHAPPDPALGPLPGGDTGTLWTTVALSSLSRPGMSLFLYETSPAYLNPRIRRTQLANRLALDKGGPLGIRRVAEVVVTAADPEARAVEWTKLLGRPKTAGLWNTVMAGPSIRLSGGGADRIRELVLEVSSLERARAFLDKEGLRGKAEAGGLTLDPAGAQGLAIRLVR